MFPNFTLFSEVGSKEVTEWRQLSHNIGIEQCPQFMWKCDFTHHLLCFHKHLLLISCQLPGGKVWISQLEKVKRLSLNDRSTGNFHVSVLLHYHLNVKIVESNTPDLRGVTLGVVLLCDW